MTGPGTTNCLGNCAWEAPTYYNTIINSKGYSSFGVLKDEMKMKCKNTPYSPQTTPFLSNSYPLRAEHISKWFTLIYFLPHRLHLQVLTGPQAFMHIIIRGSIIDFLSGFPHSFISKSTNDYLSLLFNVHLEITLWIVIQRLLEICTFVCTSSVYAMRCAAKVVFKKLDFMSTIRILIVLGIA